MAPWSGHVGCRGQQARGHQVGSGRVIGMHAGGSTLLVMPYRRQADVREMVVETIWHLAMVV